MMVVSESGKVEGLIPVSRGSFGKLRVEFKFDLALV